MKTPHKHAELIKKWADDTSLKIQYNLRGRWIDISPPSWTEEYNYRIKPEVIRYRVALLENERNHYVLTTTENAEAVRITTNTKFIKWITDWIEVELDEVEI